MNTSMNLKWLPLLAWVAMGMFVFFSGCEEEPPASLYNPIRTGGATPTITSVVPSDSALAGVTRMVITGTNFSATPANNLVFFNASQATVLQATTTELTVRAPVLISDTISLKVAVLGAELFSNVIQYKLVAAVSEFGVGATPEEPVGIACDTAGNLYVSLLSSAGTGLGVKKFTPTGVRTDYSPPFSSAINKWSAMKVGPAGYIYAAATRTALFRIPPGGGTATVWQNAGGLGTVYDFDFDQQGNIWAGGNNPAVYRVTPTRNIKAFPFLANVRSVRVYQNFLYVGGQTFPDSLEKIVRFPILSSDSLGPAETYFDFSGAYPSPSKPGVYALTFAVDGDLFVGTDTAAASIALVHQDRSVEAFYPGLLSARSLLFAYGRDTELFVSRTGGSSSDKKIIRINTQKRGAPYYGRQ